MTNKNGTGLQVTTKPGSSPEIARLLKNTIFGTEGKFRYRQKAIVEEMQSKKNLEFIQIKKGKRVLGTAGVITRETTGLTDTLKSLYVRYLSVYNPFGAKSSVRSQQNSRKKKLSGLRAQIANQITEYFETPIIEKDQKAAFYAYVESENENSRNLCISLGFHPKRKISTFLFSRIFPSSFNHIRALKESDFEIVRKSLKEHYSDYNFYFEDELFSKGTYWVATDGNEIVAGLRSRPVSWEIKEVPGFSGFLMQKVLPYLPLTNRLFNPENMNFLAFDYFWAKDGFQSELSKLMEHACSESDIYMGMFWEDTETNLHNFFNNNTSLGLLHKINGAVTADVMMRFINFEEVEVNRFLKRPVFVSALDMS